MRETAGPSPTAVSLGRPKTRQRQMQSRAAAWNQVIIPHKSESATFHAEMFQKRNITIGTQLRCGKTRLGLNLVTALELLIL